MTLRFIEGYQVNNAHSALCDVMAEIDALNELVDRLKSENLSLEEQVSQLKEELAEYQMGAAA